VDVFDPDATRDEFPSADVFSNELDLSALTIRPVAFAVVATQGHDDELALEAAVRSGIPYVAFVASRRKFDSRAEFLRARGVTDDEIARIKAPAGLDVGAVTPDEIAASILAELIQVRRQQFAPQQVEAARAVAAVEDMMVEEAQDLVCGMTVEIAGARYVSEYAGSRYYFCCASCKTSFDAEPEKYVTVKPGA
jgi:xanthine dehydrogenase accessory factor